MGTRSAIGYKTPQGTIRAKYSHYDGYVAYTGVMLRESYTEQSKIEEMVQLGDQSFLAPEIHPKGPHSFESPEEGCTIFYGRDRGESNVDSHEFETFAEFVEYYDGAGCEYFYVWDGQDWLVNDHYEKDSNGFPVFDYVEVVQLKEITA
jgi:hypothetical protein